jgi:hypothetical protein
MAMNEMRDPAQGDRQPRPFQERVREHPLPYLLGAVAVGFVVARMVRRER